MSNFPPDYCPYCGTALEEVDPPREYYCESCERPVFHNSVLGGGAVVVDGDSILLVEDFREAGTWTVPEGRPEIPESPREGVTRELEEEAGLSVDPRDLVYLYDDASEVTEGMYMMGIYYAVHRSETTGTVEAGSDATDARFWTPDEFAAADEELRDMPNPDETRSWAIGLATLRDRARSALERGTTYDELFADHVE